MANSILIEAETGAGKSTAIETLDPKTTFMINPKGQALPFRGWKKIYTPFDVKTRKGNYIVVVNPMDVVSILRIVDKEMPHIETVVVDDWSFFSTFEFMNRLSEKTYDKFNSIANGIFQTASVPKELRSNLTIFYLTHPERHENIDGDVIYKARTVGKLVNDKITVESLFTVVLYGRAKKTDDGIKYIFETQTDGQTPAKTPKGMFEQREIPNDLELVRRTVISYNE